MNAIQEIKDENVRKVAQTLRSSGLASSDTEAVRMATMMSRTSQKVTQNFDQRTGHTNHASGFPSQPSVSSTQSAAPRAYSFIHVQASPSVQEIPRKTEEKEEFIFGDVQEKETAQKKDVYKVENEFEEVVSQEVIETKAEEKQMPKYEAPKAVVSEQKSESKPAMFNGRPSMFGKGTMAENPTYFKPVQINDSSSSFAQEPAKKREIHVEPVHSQPISQQMPSQKPASNPSPTPVTAASSAQMAFASLLGSAQRTQEKHQEQKPAVQTPSAQASYSKPAEAAPAVQQSPATHQQPARVVVNHVPDPRANMMKEANVDLSKMFNVNK